MRRGTHLYWDMLDKALPALRFMRLTCTEIHETRHSAALRYSYKRQRHSPVLRFMRQDAHFNWDAWDEAFTCTEAHETKHSPTMRYVRRGIYLRWCMWRGIRLHWGVRDEEITYTDIHETRKSPVLRCMSRGTHLRWCAREEAFTCAEV
jgi:hypothetical protein